MKNVIITGLVALSSLAAVGCGDDTSDPPLDALSAYQEDFKQQTPFVEHRVPRGNHTLHAREFAPNGGGNGSPIILMHGYPDSQMLYDAIVGPLRAERQVITFDFLGWGDSDKPSDHRYDANSLLVDLEAVVAHFELDEVVVVVHDASGWPGIDWALDHEEQVAGLVLLNSVYNFVGVATPPEGLEQFTTLNADYQANVKRFGADDELWRSGVEAQVRKFMSNEPQREKYAPLFAQQALPIRPAFFQLAERLVPELTSRSERTEQMNNFKPPVSIVFGADDPYLNLGVAAEFQKLFPTAERRDIANAGHYVQLDDAAAVTAAVLAVSE